KVIATGGQVLNSAATLETYATFPEERQRLIDAITKEKISGVLFLTGDRHHTELSVLPRGDSTYALNDFTVSPLTSGLSTVQNEPNTLRAEGTFTREKNFAMMEVGGPLANRAMTITIYSNRGKQLWSRTLKANDLK
ncbi:MAG: alkaline phosphatase D family protein, partial [Rhizobacter sp.]|nr:alkaline phosphatase D family protein [Chlorobiales bacterium]